MACRLATDSASFARAAGNLLRAAGLSISPEHLRELVENEGKLLLEAQRHEQLELDFSASQCTTSTPEGEEVSRMYLGSDGVKVPLVTEAEKLKRRAKAKERRRHLPRRRGVHRRPLPAGKRGADDAYKEFKLVTYYDQEAKRRWVQATRKNHRAAGKLMARGAAQLRLRSAQQKVAVVDGAEWIKRQIEANVPYVDAVVLDYYHLSEHVHQARRGVFGEDSTEGQAWAERVLGLILEQGYEPFWQALGETRSGLRRGRRAALDDLMHYVASRRRMLDYPSYRRMGWDIGSGSTESMCKALTRRLKQRGMRWDADNAEAMMALETLEQTDGWAAWFRFRASPN